MRAKSHSPSRPPKPEFMKDIVIFGIGQQAELCRHYFVNDLHRNVIAYTIDLDYEPQYKDSLPVIKLNDLAHSFELCNIEIFIAIGGIALNSIRQYYFEKLKSMGAVFTNCISPNIIIPPNTNIGQNAYIVDNSHIGPFIKIGDNFSTTSSIIGHHSSIDNNVTVVGSTLAGNVTLKEGAFISINSSINYGVTIGEYSIIDIGCNIRSDIPPFSVVSSGRPTIRKMDSRRVKLLGESYNNFLARMNKCQATLSSPAQR
jgi:acetyltransferase-like isoleucine patch superfamily enzyme